MIERGEATVTMEKRDLDIIKNSAVNWRMYLNATVLITGAQ